MKDYFRESVRRDIPNWGKVNHCKNHNMYVNTRLSWEGRLTRKSLDFDFQLNLDDHWPTTWRLSWKGGQFFSFNNPRSKITFNFEQSTKEDLRTLYSKKKTSWCFLESQSMECKWSKNKILYNAVNIKVFPITRKAKLLHPVQHWVQGRETYQVLLGILNTCLVHKMGNLIPTFPKHWKDEKQDKVRLDFPTQRSQLNHLV